MDGNGSVSKKLNFVVTRYDETIKEPPFKTIKVDSIEVIDPLYRDSGRELASRIKRACSEKGYKFKFYSSTKEDGFDFEAVVE